MSNKKKGESPFFFLSFILFKEEVLSSKYEEIQSCRYCSDITFYSCFFICYIQTSPTQLEENSKILNPTNLYLLVPLNHTDWWNKKADDELVWLSETEYHSINKLLDLSKVANKVFEEIDVTYVEKTTPAVAKKLLLGISKEASSIVRR